MLNADFIGYFSTFQEAPAAAANHPIAPTAAVLPRKVPIEDFVAPNRRHGECWALGRVAGRDLAVHHEGC